MPGASRRRSSVERTSGDLAQRLETVAIASLRPHPRNYQAHPDDQIAHLARSVEDHGVYRPVVIASDDVILAGHGLVLALRHLGRTEVEVLRLPIASDSPLALKVLVADNEIRHLAERDDRGLSELLRTISEDALDGLVGTGFDELMLANLVVVTRPKSEIRDLDAAAEWVGMPDYTPAPDPLRLSVSFASEEDRAAFFAALGGTMEALISRGTPDRRSLSMWWPPRPGVDDMSSLRFQ